MRHRTIGGGSSFMRHKFALALSRMYSWQWVNVSWVLCYSTNFSLYGKYSSPNETHQVFMFSVLNTLCRKLSKFCPFLEDQKILTSYILMSRVSRTYPDIIFESFVLIIDLSFQIYFSQATIVKIQLKLTEKLKMSPILVNVLQSVPRYEVPFFQPLVSTANVMHECEGGTHECTNER